MWVGFLQGHLGRHNIQRSVIREDPQMSRVDPISGRGTNPVFTRAALDKVTHQDLGWGPQKGRPAPRPGGSHVTLRRSP